MASTLQFEKKQGSWMDYEIRSIFLLFTRKKYSKKKKQIRKQTWPLYSLKKQDFKLKLLIKDKEGHFIPIKRSFNHEICTKINVNTPNCGTVCFMKGLLMKLWTWVNTNTTIW